MKPLHTQKFRQAHRERCAPRLLLMFFESTLSIPRPSDSLGQYFGTLSRSRLAARTCYREAAAQGTTVHAMTGRAAATAAKHLVVVTFSRPERLAACILPMYVTRQLASQADTSVARRMSLTSYRFLLLSLAMFCGV